MRRDSSYAAGRRVISRVNLGVVLFMELTATVAVRADIIRVVIDERAPLDDHVTNQYEEIRGRLFGEVDPLSAPNALIQDIQLAPVNAHGKVEYIATFTLHRPLESSKNARVLLDVIPNRGHRYGSDPVYYDRGYSMVWIGWQGDLPERPAAQKSTQALALESIWVPSARNKDGSEIFGSYLVRVPAGGGGGPTGETMKPDQGSAGSLAYFPASYDTRRAALTGGPAEDVTGSPTGKRYLIRPGDWSWWNCARDSPAATAMIPAELCVKRLTGVFSPAETYELRFTARDPLVLALGLAATRDAVSFFRYAKTDSIGERNPLAGQIDQVVSHGASQSGNFVKTFIALGFNQDERGRIVWDGANSHIGGRRTPINYRFAIPGSSPTLFMPGSEGVLWWGDAVDAIRGGPSRSLLDRCTASRTCPKIFETFGGAELWNQRMTPALVGFDLKGDIPLPDNVRRYYFPGTGHGGGRGGFSLQGTRVLPATPGVSNPSSPNPCAMQFNPNPEDDQLRALTVALVDWTTNGTPPPPSRYPSLARGELVKDSAGSYPFPGIPGVPKPFGLANPVIVYDYGSQFDYADQSGVILKMPPEIKGVVPALVAKVDVDGNETGGVPSVQHMVPVGTYLSWNTSEGPNTGRGICSYTGGFVPFERTRAARVRSKDPRLSIEERYGNRQGFLCAVRRAVKRSIRRRFLLEEDGNRLMEEATVATTTGDLAFLPDTRDAQGQSLCAGPGQHDLPR